MSKISYVNPVGDYNLQVFVRGSKLFDNPTGWPKMIRAVIE